MKKFFAVMMALALLAALPTAAMAEDDTVYTEGTLYYTVRDDSITVTGCFGGETEITVPAMIAGIPVNVIGTGAFARCANLDTLNLPDSITAIETGAIPDGVTVIYDCNTAYPSLVPSRLLTGELGGKSDDVSESDGDLSGKEENDPGGAEQNGAAQAAALLRQGKPYDAAALLQTMVGLR